MKTFENIIAISEKKYTVIKKYTNHNKALLPNALYDEMVNYVNSLTLHQYKVTFENPQLYKLQLLKNAYLNDTLNFNAQIKEFDEKEIHILVWVNQKRSKNNPTICKAIFKIQFNEKIPEAS